MGFLISYCVILRRRFVDKHIIVINLQMRKVLALLLMLVAITSALTDKEIIQTGINGLWEQNKLPDPTTIVPCIDDDTAHKLVVFAGQVFDKAAKGSPSDLISLIKIFKDFASSLP